MLGPLGQNRVSGLWMDLTVNFVAVLPFCGFVMCEVTVQDLMYSLHLCCFFIQI